MQSNDDANRTLTVSLINCNVLSSQTKIVDISKYVVEIKEKKN